MERAIEIDGKSVKFRATAAVPRLYRIKFRRDIMQDMVQVKKDIDTAAERGGVPVSSLEMFENIAYIMAKHAAGSEVPDSVEKWLDNFNTFSIYQVFPQIAELWRLNEETLVPSKKKSSPAPGS